MDNDHAVIVQLLVKIILIFFCILDYLKLNPPLFFKHQLPRIIILWFQTCQVQVKCLQILIRHS